MSDVIRTSAIAEVHGSASVEDVRTGMSAAALRQAIEGHLRYPLGRPFQLLQPQHYYHALALAVRHLLENP